MRAPISPFFSRILFPTVAALAAAAGATLLGVATSVSGSGGTEGSSLLAAGLGAGAVVLLRRAVSAPSSGASTHGSLLLRGSRTRMGDPLPRTRHYDLTGTRWGSCVCTGARDESGIHV